jgi:hypothetical protein
MEQEFCSEHEKRKTTEIEVVYLGLMRGLFLFSVANFIDTESEVNSLTGGLYMPV